MRRAIRIVSLVALAVTCFALAGHSEPQIIQNVNGIGIVDYSQKPTFHVGDWVRYHMTGESHMGMHDDYDLTILIAGEELWWGEECFWLETWTDAKGRVPETASTLMSYAIFEDSAAIQHLQVYQRKSIDGIDENGFAKEQVVRPAAGTSKSRTLFKRPVMWDVDTLEADTVQTPAGLFHARKVSIRQGTSATSTLADSTLYTEVRENRMTWYAPEVPITHIAKEDVENTIARRAWMIGRSAEGSPLQMRERGTGVARLVAFGHGLKARLLPVERQKSFAELRAAAAHKASAPARKVPARRR